MVGRGEIGKTVSTNECIEWDKNITLQGYGRICEGGKQILAHRAVWVETRGPIPKGLCVLHHCDNRPCINIEHLFLGTDGDNVRDRILKHGHQNSKKTHCPQGHEYTARNMFPGDIPHGRGRRCKTCHVERNRQRRKREKVHNLSENVR